MREVATSLNSINSSYHRKDMKLIASSGSDCLDLSFQFAGFSYGYGLNTLAMNKASLKDKYHLENMSILATNPKAKKYLCLIMTDSLIIKNI